MNKEEIINEITQIERKAKSLVFSIVSHIGQKELYHDGLSIVVDLAYIKKSLVKGDCSDISSSQKEKEATVVKKVTRQLRRWVNNQSIINALILNEYLKLQRDGVIHITEGILKSSLGDDTNFFKYFYQMTSDHSKIFNVLDDGRRENIIIWDPIKCHIEEYGKDVGIL